MRIRLGLLSLLISVALGCSFQARECCDCMSTKSTLFGECMKDDIDQCINELSKSPPNVDVISGVCRTESDGYCPESCADILYKK